MYGLIAKQIGVRESPSSAELKGLVGFTKRNFGDFSPKEIRLCFDLLLARKLGIEENKIEHFQGFNPKYLGFVLSKYRKFRNDAIKEFEKKQKEMREKEAIEKLNSPEHHKEIYNNLIMHIEKGHVPDSYPYRLVFEHMDVNDIIEDTNDEIQKFVNKILGELKTQYEDAKLSGSQVKLNIVIKRKNNFTDYWKAQWAKQWAKECIKANQI